MLLASTADALTGAWFARQKHFPRAALQWLQAPAPPILSAARRWLDDYFSGHHPDIEKIPLAPSGTPFQQRVWNMLRAIPYGNTTTYGALAQRLAPPRMAAQAVGGAVGRNPLSIIIPCHRVLGSGGALTGYAAGLDIKRRLLQHEGICLSPANIAGELIYTH